MNYAIVLIIMSVVCAVFAWIIGYYVAMQSKKDNAASIADNVLIFLWKRGIVRFHNYQEGLEQVYRIMEGEDRDNVDVNS